MSTEYLEVRSVVNGIFQSCQSTAESRRALALNLKREHINALQSDLGTQFIHAFAKCVDRILNLSHKDQCGNRITDFVAEYVKCVSPEGENEDISDPKARNADMEMITDSGYENEFQNFIYGLTWRYLRGFESQYASVRARCVKLVTCFVQYLVADDAFYDKLMEKSVSRMRDVDVQVRNYATYLTSLFDLTETTKEALAIALQHDPSPEVRAMALYNLAHGNKQLSELSCERVRDASTQIRRIAFQKVLRRTDFRTLSIKARENIVHAGLNDRDANVRRAATELVAIKWMEMENNNFVSVLARLDVIENTEIADLVVRALIDTKRDLINKFDFGPSFFDENLWVEDVVLLRGFQEFCIDEKLTEMHDEWMPDLLVLAGEILKLWNKYIDEKTYSELMTDEDVAQMKEGLPFMVEQLLLVASRYDLDDEAGRQRITYVLNSIMASAPVTPTNTMIKHIVAIQRRLNASDTALLSWAFETLEAMQNSEAGSDEDILASLLRELVLFKSVLELVTSKDVAPYLPSLYSSYLEKVLIGPFNVLQVTALECLALSCLLDDKFAGEHLSKLVGIVEENGLVTGDDQEIINAVCVCVNALSDLLLTFEDINLSTQDIVKLFVNLLTNSDIRVESVAATSLCKLVLAGLIDDPSAVLVSLMNLYFQNNDQQVFDENAALLQQKLILFLRAYCSIESGKIALAYVFSSVLANFLEFKSKSSSSVTLGDIINQFLDLTSNEKPTDSLSKPGNVTAQSIMAITLVSLMFSTSDAVVRRSTSSALSRLSVESISANSLDEMVKIFEQNDINIFPTNVTREAAANFLKRVLVKREAILQEHGDTNAETVLPSIRNDSEDNADDEQTKRSDDTGRETLPVDGVTTHITASIENSIHPDEEMQVDEELDS